MSATIEEQIIDLLADRPLTSGGIGRLLWKEHTLTVNRALDRLVDRRLVEVIPGKFPGWPIRYGLSARVIGERKIANRERGMWRCDGCRTAVGMDRAACPACTKARPAPPAPRPSAAPGAGGGEAGPR